MSFFPVAFQELSPLFRIIDEASRPSRQCAPRTTLRQRTFQPKFDVKELKNSYELLGELPGVEQKDINIEWTDGNTLTISGHSESRVEKSSPSPAPTATEPVSEEKQAENASYHAPSVEEEDDGELINKPTDSETETDNVASTSEKAAEANATVPDPEISTPAEQTEQARYWVSERTSGSFSRGFRFPVRIEQENVKASLKNGILSITIPKAKIPEPRTIVIE
jgi:HSP20 family molecular chaperone IbpA